MATLPAAEPESGAPDVRRWTGISAIAIATLLLAEASIQLIVGGRPSLLEAEALREFVTENATAALTVVLVDTFLMAALIVFLTCFRELMTRARPDLGWIADLGYGAGLIWVGITLVGDAMAGGAALDTIGDQPDAVVIRALTEGHMLIFGAIGSTLTALVAATAGYLTLASDVLPRWTGRLAYLAAVLNLLAIPTIFGGTDETAFLSVGGWANAVLATFPWLLWVVVVGIVTIRGQRHDERKRALAG